MEVKAEEMKCHVGGAEQEVMGAEGEQMLRGAWQITLEEVEQQLDVRLLSHHHPQEAFK